MENGSIMDKQLRKYREGLLDTLRFLNASYDKLLATLSGGGLVVSVTFISYAKDDIVCLKWLFIGCVLCVSCLLFIAIRIIVAIEAYRKAVTQVDDETIHEDRPGGVYAKISRWVLYLLPFVLCFAGVCMISYFAYCNLQN